MSERLTERDLSELVMHPERMTYADLAMVVEEVRRLRHVIIHEAVYRPTTFGAVYEEASAIREETR